MRVINIDGGIGRVICSIPAIEKASKKEEIVVLTHHTQVFQNNPNIYRVLHPTTPYIFEDYIFENNFEHPEPYQLNKYYRGEIHLIQAFDYLINNKIEDVVSTPNIYLTPQEDLAAKNILSNLDQNKKILLFQPFGSTNSINTLDNNKTIDNSNRSLKEDHANYIIEKLNNKYEILYIGNYFAKSSEGFYVYDLTIRNIFSLCKLANYFIGIDSFLMHSANCFNLNGTVFFGAMNINNLCYDNQNIIKKDNLSYEPLRIPVNMEYSKKNNDSMDFTIEEIDNAIEGLL